MEQQRAARIAFAVSLANGRWLLRDVERFGELCGREYVKRLFVDGVQSVQAAARVDFATELINAAKQGLSIFQPITGQILQCHIVLSRTCWPEGGVADSEEAGKTRRPVGRVPSIGSKTDEGRDGGTGRSL